MNSLRPMVDREVERWQQRTQLLEKQYSELAQIAGSLAHEIKNPLSVIRMNMELVEEDLEESETLRERRVWTKLQTVHAQCQRLEKLLNDFMKFARLRDLDLEIGSLNRQITLVLDMYEAQARAQGVQINRYLDPEFFLLGIQPVYHPADAGCQEHEGRAAWRHSRGFLEALHPVHRRFSGHHGFPIVCQPDTLS